VSGPVCSCGILCSICRSRRVWIQRKASLSGRLVGVILMKVGVVVVVVGVMKGVFRPLGVGFRAL
jgi:hypothetical protein